MEPSSLAVAPWAIATSAGSHRGELAIAEEWRQELAVLPPETAFRVVVLTSPTSGEPPATPDPRVLWVAAPAEAGGAGPRQVAPSLAREAAPVYGALARIQDEVLRQPPFLRFLGICRDFLSTYRYVAAAEVPETAQELAMDRMSLLAQLSPAHLADHAEVWPSLAASCSWFRARYRALYQERHRHHRAEQAQALELAQATSEKVEALQRLDTIAPLGPPAGQAAIAAWRALPVELSSCAAQEEAEDFAAVAPWCTLCGLTSRTPSPMPQAAAALAAVDAALAAQLRRLSSQTVRRILAADHRSRLERFLEVLQASDVVSLTQVLDDELAAFIAGLLSEALGAAHPARVFAGLREQFGVLEEGQIPQAVREFERLLQQAAEEARQGQPGAPVTLRLE